MRHKLLIAILLAGLLLPVCSVFAGHRHRGNGGSRGVAIHQGHRLSYSSMTYGRYSAGYRGGVYRSYGTGYGGYGSGYSGYGSRYGGYSPTVGYRMIYPPTGFYGGGYNSGVGLRW